MERKLTNLAAFFGFIICCLMIFFAIYFTPDFIATKMSSDGILESRTILRINALRILAATIGILILLVSIIRPNLFYSIPCALRSLRERTVHTTLKKGNISIYSLIFLLSIVIAIFASLGEIWFQSYLYAHQALMIVSGQGLGGHYHWPPGYAMLIAPLIKCGLSPLRSAWIISLVSFGVASTIIYAFSRRLTTHLGGAIATTLFVFNPVLIRWANSTTSEMLFICTTLLAFSAFDFCYFSDTDPTKRKSFLVAIITGFLLATPFWIRYLGILIPIIGFGSLVFLICLVPSQRTKALTSVVSMTVFISPLIVRNIFFAGFLTGHPMGQQPADTFLSAFVSSLRHIGHSWLGKIHFIPEIILVIAIAVGLLLLPLSNLKRLRFLIISSFPILFITLLAYVASHTRIDVINERFVVPTFPYIAISLSLLWHNYGRYSQAYLLTGPLINIVLVALCFIIIVRGSMVVLKGYNPSSDLYSPITIDYIREHLPKGTTISGNRYGGQILAHTLDYEYIQIPFADPWNADLPKARGIEPWTRKEAIEVFLEKEVRYIAFFLGTNNDDPYLRVGAYGEYVSSMLTESLPEIYKISKTHDGILISLVEKEKLLRIYDELG